MSYLVDMLILDYFTVSPSKSVSKLMGLLSNRIAFAVIKLANREVCVALNEKLPESATS